MELLPVRTGTSCHACGMKVTIVAEASHPWQYRRRWWGLALAVGDDMLLDTFSHPLGLRWGAWRCRFDLARVRDIVISHDHWDHTGGLALVRQRAPQATVHIPGGADELAARLLPGGVEPHIITATTALREHVLLLGPLVTIYKGKPLAEQALVIRGSSGYALLLGCAHAGIAAWLALANAAGLGTPNLVLGGLHLSGADAATQADALAACRRHGVQRLAPCHCTGAGFMDYCRAVIAAAAPAS